MSKYHLLTLFLAITVLLVLRLQKVVTTTLYYIILPSAYCPIIITITIIMTTIGTYVIIVIQLQVYNIITQAKYTLPVGSTDKSV